jgi:hypothetical protein|tara:strand:+ start:297 stop:506 length:210 start_codon:yes stop_codon:yes gene_type:complete
MEWDELRGIRYELLKEMDVYQLAIVWETLELVQQSELRKYRQDLLMLPQEYETADLAYENLPDKPTWMS